MHNVIGFMLIQAAAELFHLLFSVFFFATSLFPISAFHLY